MNVIDDLNRAFENAAVTYQERAMQCRGNAADFQRQADDPRNYPLRQHKLALAARATAEAEDWERLMDGARNGVHIHIRNPSADQRRLPFWNDLTAAATKAGRVRYDPHTGGNTRESAEGSPNRGSNSDGQGG